MKTLKINTMFCIYFLFCLIVILNDYFALIFGNEKYFFTILLSAFLVLAGWGMLWKKGQVKHYNTQLEKKDILISLIILVIGLIKIPFPDNSYDITNYHLYFQEFFNRDFVEEDFFPIRAVNAHYFILGDRLLYVFRFFCGYRFGTILNTLVIILLYFQLKEFFIKYIDIENKKINHGIIALAVGIGLFSENVLWNFDMYTIDFLAVPLIMELLRIAVGEKEKTSPIYTCIVAGIAISIKISNVYFIIILAAIYLWKYAKELKIKEITVSAVSAVLMFVLYMIVSFQITGNPLFPYANGIFKSKYFSLVDGPSDLSGLVGRFGPRDWFEYVTWPVYMILHPEQSNDMYIYTGRVLVTGIVLLIVICTLKKINYGKKFLQVCSLWVCMYLLSIFVYEGYNRYVALMDVLGGIIIVVLLWNWFQRKAIWSKIGAIIISIVVLLQSVILGKSYFVDNKEPGWRGNIFNATDSYMNNFKYLFQDHGSGIDEELLEDVEEWFVLDCNGSYALQMKEDVPVVGLTMSATNEETTKMLEKRINDVNEKNVYSYMTVYDQQVCFDTLAENSLKIDELVSTKTNFTPCETPLTLLKLKKSEKEVVYSCYDSFNIGNQKIILSDDKKETDWKIGFLPVASEWQSDGFIASIYVVNASGENLLYEEEIKPYDPFGSFDIPQEYYDNQTELVIKISNKEGCNETADYFSLIGVTEVNE